MSKGWWVSRGGWGSSCGGSLRGGRVKGVVGSRGGGGQGVGGCEV